jgi:hypothetical protein
MEPLTIEQIRQSYPNQWVLIGSPTLRDPEINGSIISKIISGIVLFASPDKRELAYKSADLKKNDMLTACIYTGILPQKRLFLL